MNDDNPLFNVDGYGLYLMGMLNGNGSVRARDITDAEREFFAEHESGSMGAWTRSDVGYTHDLGRHRTNGGIGRWLGDPDSNVGGSSLRASGTEESRVSWVAGALLVGLPLAFVIFNNLMVMSEQNQQVRWRLERIAAWARYIGEYALWMGKQTWK